MHISILTCHLLRLSGASHCYSHFGIEFGRTIAFGSWFNGKITFEVSWWIRQIYPNLFILCFYFAGNHVLRPSGTFILFVICGIVVVRSTRCGHAKNPVTKSEKAFSLSFCFIFVILFFYMKLLLFSFSIVFYSNLNNTKVRMYDLYVRGYSSAINRRDQNCPYQHENIHCSIM